MTVVDPEPGAAVTGQTPVVPVGVGRPRARFGRLVPNLVLIGLAFYFIAPLLALARFSLQNVPVILLNFSTLFDKWSLGGVLRPFEDPIFWDSLTLTLKLAVGTVVLTLALLLPTAIWVHMRLPKARGLIEFVTVLPYMIPAIALVAGIKIVKPHARWFLDSEYSLIPFYVVLALPFTYRSIDAGLRALDLRTLVDAARSLGASWTETVLRVLVPNLRTSIISASFLTAAVVMGEYTLARLLLIDSLAPYQRILVGKDSQAGYGLNLLALVFTTGLFALIGVLTRKRDRARDSFAHRTAKLAHSTETTPA